jgi:hypothetical protein
MIPRRRREIDGNRFCDRTDEARLGLRAPLLDPRPDDREAIQKRLKELKLL